MVAKVSNDRIIELWREMGSTKAVTEVLNKDGIKIDLRTVQRRVSAWRKANPDSLPAKGPRKEATPDTRPIAGGELLSPDKRRKSLTGRKFVFTSAQNNTHVHEGFLGSLEQFLSLIHI